MKKRGFTLIEMLIYMALFSIIIGGAIIFAYNIFESINRNQTKAMMAEEGMYLMGKIDWALTGIKTADVYESGQLSIDKRGIPPTDNPLVFDAFDGMIRLKRGINEAQILNNANVAIDNLVFVHTVSSGDGITPESVSVFLTITAKTPAGLELSENFHTIKYIRK